MLSIAANRETGQVLNRDWAVLRDVGTFRFAARPVHSFFSPKNHQNRDFCSGTHLALLALLWLDLSAFNTRGQSIT